MDNGKLLPQGQHEPAQQPFLLRITVRSTVGRRLAQ